MKKTTSEGESKILSFPDDNNGSTEYRKRLRNNSDRSVCYVLSDSVKKVRPNSNSNSPRKSPLKNKGKALLLKKTYQQEGKALRDFLLCDDVQFRGNLSLKAATCEARECVNAIKVDNSQPATLKLHNCNNSNQPRLHNNNPSETPTINTLTQDLLDHEGVIASGGKERTLKRSENNEVKEVVTDNTNMSMMNGKGKVPEPKEPKDADKNRKEDKPTGKEDRNTQIAVKKCQEEIDQIQRKLSKLKEGSMERMFMEMRLEMKKDTATVLLQINNVSSDNNKLTIEVEKLKTDSKDMNSRLEHTQNVQEEFKKSIGDRKSEIEEVREEVHILKSIVQKQEQQLSLARSSNESVHMQTLRNRLFVTGIEKVEEENDDTTAELATNFLSQTMRVGKPIAIISAVRKGNRAPRGIDITLKYAKDRNEILKHGKNLKDVRNGRNKPYHVNSQMPLSMQEQRRKHSKIIQMNSKLPDGAKRTITKKRDVLYIDNKVYTPAVTVPSVLETVSPHDKKRVQEIVVSPGEIQRKGGCRFLGYSAEVKDIRDVKAAYVKVKRMNPSALHVGLGYRLPGLDVSKQQSYEDDSEHGCGRVIFELLENSQIEHRAVFVVRYYGNEHLGPVRFSLIQAAAKSAITRSSFNAILQMHQFVNLPERRKDMGKGELKAGVIGNTGR